MDEKFNDFLKRDMDDIENKLHEYSRRSPRFHVYEQMQKSYANFCERAK